jgi:hypothetical protein
MRPPFPDEAVLARMVGHLVLSFEIDSAGMAHALSSEFATSRREVDEALRRGMH